MKIQDFFDEKTFTYSYVIFDEETKKSAIIDSVLDYDQFSGATDTKSADQVIAYIKEYQLENEWILETHAHADHLTAAQYVKKEVGGKIAIGANITKVAAFWSPLFNSDIATNSSDFDRLLEDDDVIHIGNLALKVLYTPGHTPACCCYVVQDVIFTGDTIFQPHLGTARCDFPGGSAKDLYHSIQKIYALPDDYRIYMAHDYPASGDEAKCCVTVKEQKEKNSMLSQDTSEEDYIRARTKRDKTLAVPKLLLPSIQFNLRAGSFGKTEDNQIHYIKIPINQLR